MASLSWSLKTIFFHVFLTSLISIDAKTTLSPRQFLKNGQTLISTNNRFELGFFNVSSKTESNRDLTYLGIWYRGITPLTVVWVANRDKPLRGNGAKLFMNPGGNLLLRDDEGNMIPLTRLNQAVDEPLMVLLDSGNLVIKDGENGNVWESFNFPSDTLLPGMKLGWELKTGLNRVLTSWRTFEDPIYGDFVFGFESPTSPQLLLDKNGLTQSRWGPWNGKRFSGINMKDNNPVFKTVYHFGETEVYFSFEMLDDSVLLRLVVSSMGAVQFLKWKSSSNVWVPMVTLNKDVCDRYGSCGPYGICYADEPGCRCLNGFIENSPYDWRRLDCLDGCRRANALNCSDRDGFVKHGRVKLPDNFTVWKRMSAEKCGDSCLEECSCMAYTNIDIYGNGISECVVWLDQLIDLRDSGHDGDELYIRMARVDIDEVQERQSIPVKNEEQYIHLFDMNTISAATDNFSLANKIGEGGFGPVYQGGLQNGQEIAVKRLSESSKQGLQEFKNEMSLIAQLQHRNLVKLFGCCIEGEDRMLIYEGYMSPEYVTNGNYSMKSDVFSFGVLALEIISGQRNWGFQHPDHDFNLLGHAWKLWTEGRDLEIIDPVLDESFVETQVSRCIQVGLLCVQHVSEGRPTMSQVVSMLENEDVRLSEPQEPGFFSQLSAAEFDPFLGWDQETVNGLTVTDLTGRS
ncbi:hypothetical protein DH2020_017345 [Rehmannia glutinosa]|uniref:Receptor-like serine/threonine-protein kinase n=1 Tax=Rehmannia glutinosa TaxID=99300 RepID=A0ABR0WUV2_REHGL